MMVKKQSVRTLFQSHSKAIRAEHRECINCQEKFAPKRKKQKFCSSNCRKRFWERKKVLKTLISVLNEFLAYLNEKERKGGQSRVIKIQRLEARLNAAGQGNEEKEKK